MKKGTLVLTVRGKSAGESNELTALLMTRLGAAIEGIQLSRVKSSKETLDLGATIITVVGTQFAVELVKTIHAWLLRNHSARLYIGSDGEIEASGISSEELLVIVEKVISDDSEKAQADL